MAKKYTNFRIGGSPQKTTDDYTMWSNDLLQRIIASKTVIQPGKSTKAQFLSTSNKLSIWVRPGVLDVRTKLAWPIRRPINELLPTLERPAKAISGKPNSGSFVKVGADAINFAAIMYQSSLTVNH
mgnify:CR=1 FL=1